MVDVNRVASVAERGIVAGISKHQAQKKKGMSNSSWRNFSFTVTVARDCQAIF